MSTKEAMDLVGSRRRASGPKAGSVWESRLKLDELKGGIKVFNATHENSQENTQNTNSTTTLSNNTDEIQMDKKVNDVRPKQSPIGGMSSSKRKTWKSESSEGSPVQIARQRSELNKNLDEQFKELSVALDGIKKSPVWIKKKRSLSNEKNAIQLRKVKSDSTDQVINDSKSEPDEKIKNSDNGKVDDEPNKDLEGSIGKIDKSPIGVEKSRSDEDCEEKEITSNVSHQIKNVSSDEDEEIEVEKKSLEIKEISVQEHKPKKIVTEEKKLLHRNEISVPISPAVKKQHQIPAVNHARFHPSPAKTKPIDLVMWRDVSKSAFIFGIGTFAIVSSSYTKDLNISFISVISYLGLVYLAAIFIFRSLINRGSMEMENENQDCVVGEEEAIWVWKNDKFCLWQLAVLLFILARCGSSITIWKMAKLGFIGVFTVPKICSTYSTQLTAYAVAFAIFTLVWNLSSVVARIWAVFMLFVAFKYYQQSLIRGECAQEEATRSENYSWQEQSIGEQKLGRRSTFAEMRKPKKVC
ncbi:hypothetical protein DH2020_014240 [Rehmannia glutinosa]|uniref:Reticulon domain-containing protein n=1 Tax=Rehmannia glutinosa TaxID=99300 RepID=A0ABR0WZU3_REHGL